MPSGHLTPRETYAQQVARLTPRTATAQRPTLKLPNEVLHAPQEWNQDRKKWWNEYCSVVSARDKWRLEGSVPLMSIKSPRRLVPLQPADFFEQKQEALWKRIGEKRDKRAMMQITRAMEEQQQATVEREEASKSIAAKKARSLVSGEDLWAAKKAICQKWEDRFSTLHRGFLLLDADRSGTITRDEFKSIVLTFNLDSVVTGDVFDALFEELDEDNSGMFDYNEMRKVFGPLVG